jgi:hypothetical protein
VYVRGIRYTKLECVGRGGSSKVFKVGASKQWQVPGCAGGSWALDAG